MQAANVETPSGTKTMFRTGWALTGFVGLFLLVDGGARLAGFAPYVEGMTKFGYPASLAPQILRRSTSRSGTCIYSTACSPTA